MTKLQVNGGEEVKLCDMKMIGTRNGIRFNKVTRNEFIQKH